MSGGVAHATLTVGSEELNLTWVRRGSQRQRGLPGRPQVE